MPSTAKSPLPDMINAVEITAPGGPDALTLCTRPMPQPGPNQVLIKVAAAGVNRPDVLQRMGLYPPQPGITDIPGLEVAGEIVALGKEAPLQLGSKVCALLPGGGYADYAIADTQTCLPIPDGLSMVEAASLPETFFTVWTNVFEDAALQPEETLLVHGGTSGIGMTALSLALAKGAKVIATAGTDEKCDTLNKAGATAFNYKTQDWAAAIQKAGGVDVVLDMVGGDYMAKNLTCLKPLGRHVSIAFLRGFNAEVNILEIMQKRLRITGSTLRARSVDQKGEIAMALFSEVWPLLAAGKITPVIDRTFPLKAAADAHRLMEESTHIGKIILEV